MEHFKYKYPSPLGTLILIADQEHLLEIQMTDDNVCTASEPMPAPLENTVRWLDDYFAGKTPSPHALSVHLPGTAFQQEVWSYLPQIPYGQTVTYGEIAAKIAAKRGIRRMSAQAVGQAVGANPIPVVIPCHRVVGASGALVGYACGLERKQWLLNFERKK